MSEPRNDQLRARGRVSALLTARPASQQFLTAVVTPSRAWQPTPASRSASTTETRGFADSGQAEFKLAPSLPDLDAYNARSVMATATS
jgi:hypothetical protein